MAYLTIAFFLGLAGGTVGRIKGGSFVLWFAVAFVLPIVGLMAAVLHRVEADEPRRLCPGCGRVVKLHDAICTRCSTELEWDEHTVLVPSKAEAADRRRASVSAS